MYLIKKIISIVLISMVFSYNAAFWLALDFTRDFRNELLTDPTGGNETVYSPGSFNISADRTLSENIRLAFYPSNDSSVLLRVIRVIMIWVLVVYFAWTGIDFMLNPNDEGKNKAARRSFMYLLFGAFLVWWVTWILWRWLAIDNLSWWTENASTVFVNNLIWRVIFQVLSFLKAFAFFYAIIITMWYGFNMIRALDKEDAIKSAKRWVMNVLLALIFIKVIDFVFFIAQDYSFVSRAKTFMMSIAKALWYILWAVMVITLIYTGFKYLTAQWDESKVKDAKNILSTIFYVILIVFLFLLVAWQIIAEFA